VQVKLRTFGGDVPSLPTVSSGRLLVVEDDLKLARTLQRGLTGEGFAVDLAHSGNDALLRTLEHDYDAVVLDVLLPGMDGYAVCRSLRERDRWVPVLMLTALGEVSDRIRGLDTGADDYLVKPFDFGELLARLRALIRRGPSERPMPVQLGQLHADPLTRVATWAGTSAELTPREYDLLAFMLRRPGEIVTRDQITANVWPNETDPSPNIVDVYVGYLRRKLEAPSGRRLIRTVRGAGFVLEPGAA
jgi:two-component system, OmpR family, response regulator